MVLRYLRVPDSSGNLISLFDKEILPRVESGTLKHEHAPRELLYDFDVADKAIRELYTDPKGNSEEAKKQQEKVKKTRDEVIAQLKAEKKRDLNTVLKLN